MSYTALVIGLGRIGLTYDIDFLPSERVSTFVRAFSILPDFELIGGVDSDIRQRELLEKNYNVPAYSDIHEAIKIVTPDVVVIATPTNLHFDIYKKIVGECIPKIIICEKPLSYKISEAQDMVASAKQMGVKLLTNYIRRSDRAVIEVQKKINDGIIEGPYKGVCWYSKGLIHNGSHFLDLFQFWFGEIQSYKIVKKGRFWDSKDPEPDIVVIFKEAVIYFLAAQEENFSHYTVEIVAQNGRLRYERGTMEWQSSVTDVNNPEHSVLGSEKQVIESDTPFLLLKMVEQISKNLSGIETSICSGEEGLKLLQQIESIKNNL